MNKLTGTEWSFDSIDHIWEIVKEAAKKYNWQGYPTQFEIVSTEQMMNCYVSNGLPIMYSHWSFGKEYIELENTNNQGKLNLAYELVINSNPSICYLLDSNTQCMQILTIAHAAIGHNHFFKNNYLFKQWTQPATIIDELRYIKQQFDEYRLKYGSEEVDAVISLAHAIAPISVNKYIQHPKLKKDKKASKQLKVDEVRNTYDPLLHGEFADYKQKQINRLFDKDWKHTENLTELLVNEFKLPKYVKYILTSIAKINQYFYPQMQDKVMNEGFASFVHHTIMHDLYDAGHIDESYILEFTDSHCGVCYQHGFDGKHFVGINPYYLGFNVFKDIQRMCTNPTDEDKEFCPSICNTNWIETINYVVANYRDESFILEFLSPYLIRKLKLVEMSTKPQDDEHYYITEIHDNYGYDQLRQRLAAQLSLNYYYPHFEFFYAQDMHELFATYSSDLGNALNTNWEIVALALKKLVPELAGITTLASIRSK